MKKLVIDPVTRIEGHAKIDIFLDDAGHVTDTHFHVTQVRGFEKFTEGRPFYEMPAITARICGICPVSHLLASAKACDAIMAVTPPPAGVKLRELIHCAQFVQSHALSFFHLSAPDLLLGFDSDPAHRNIFGLIEDNPDMARAGVALRKFGQEIIQGLAQERVHPSWIVPGGVNAPLESDGARPHSRRTAERRARWPNARSPSSRPCSTSSRKRSPISVPDPTMYAGLVDGNGGPAMVRRPTEIPRCRRRHRGHRHSGARLRPVHRRGRDARFVLEGAVLQTDRLPGRRLPRGPAGAAECGGPSAARRWPTGNWRNSASVADRWSTVPSTITMRA